MVYLGPPPDMTTEEMVSALSLDFELIAILNAEPRLRRSRADNAADVKAALAKNGAGQPRTIDDVYYEQQALLLALAPEHFRPGFAGWWHRLGCTLEREQNGHGAHCRQAKDLVDALWPVPNPNRRYGNYVPTNR